LHANRLENSGDFAVRMFSNATGHNYAFADSGPSNNEYAGIMMWHNRMFPSPRRAYTARLVTQAQLPPWTPSPASGGNLTPGYLGGRYPAWSLLFWDAKGSTADLDSLPLVEAYEQTSSMFIRSNWSGSAEPGAAATLLSFKGGGTYWSHNHRDLGSFSFESRGVRWAEDLGLESYAVGGADNPRNYRITTLGHNTMTFAGANQAAGTSWCIDPHRRSEGECATGTGTLLLSNVSQPASSFAIFELSHANAAGTVASWRRGFAT